MKKTIITISRTYGAHGTAIGARLASELGIPMMDRKVIELASEKSGLSPDYIDRLEEHASGSFLFNLVSNSYASGAVHHHYEIPTTYTAFSAQATVIRELAEKESCVLIGRCSDYILREDENSVKVFLYAEHDDRIEQCKKEFGLDDKSAESQIKKLERSRANYYRNFTGEPWGQAYAHDLSINTTRVGIDGAVAVIKAYLRAMGKI